jgi:outer membrane lipoprotein-sorting protein
MIRFISITALILATTSAAIAQSGTAAVNALSSKYAGMKSYSHHASLTTVRTAAERVVTTGVQLQAKFERPSKLKLDASGPSVGGAISVGITSGELTLYSGGKNQFQKKKVAANESGIMATLGMIGLKMEIDPISFLCSPRAGDILLSPRMGKSTTVNGAACNVIEAQLKLPKQVPGLTTRVSVYVDSKTGLIAKSKVLLSGVPFMLPKVVVKGGRKQMVPVRGTANMTMTYVYSDVKVNPPFGGADFNVDIPKGAVEYKLDSMIKGAAPK